MSLTTDIERVLSEHRSFEALALDGSGYRCSCGEMIQPADFAELMHGKRKAAAATKHEAHLAEQIAALVEQAEGDHLAAFLAQLPDHLFSEAEIQRVREWAGEWSG